MKKNILPNLIQTEDCKNFRGISVETHDILSYSPHRHAFYEFDYIKSGNAEVSQNGVIHKISAGQLVFTLVIAMVFFKEKLSVKQLLAIAFGIVAIVLLNIQ